MGSMTLMGAGGPSGAAPFVATLIYSDAQALPAGSSTIPLTGAQAGDLLFIETWEASTATGTATLAGQGAVSKLSPNGAQTGADGSAKYGMRAVTLNSTDAAGTIATNTSAGITYYQIAVWRITQAGVPVSGLTVTVKDFQQLDETATTLAFAGFTHAAKAVLTLLFVIDRQNTTPSGGNPLLTGWTRDYAVLPGSVLRFYQFSNLAYADAAFTVTGLTNGATAPNGYNSGFVVEVTTP